MPKIILDCDVGIDDALAILWLADRPGVEIAALGSVHGNAHADVAAANAQHVFDLVGLGHVPVAVGAEAPLAQPVSISGHVHGDDGLGGHGPQAPLRPFAPETAAEQLVRLARAEPGAHAILATGPLTNLALALHLEPELPRLVERVVVMGGAVTVPGNITAAAEANIFHDPEAAEAVFAASWPVTLVGLDVTMTAWLGEAELARIEADSRPRGRFACSILQHYVGFYHARYGIRGCALHDPAAAMLLLDPGLADYAEWPVRVELSGDLTRGMTLADRRGVPEEQAAAGRPAVRVATRIDRDRVVGGFLDGLLR
ncbi:nucleoside hydrolase [Inquilinus sp. Marseille-Q2685]|uniref:nucleoside hydrolase n=1 Tax=Inquilinus sp. Marseille-Q2685 TaxID=2866581 RepID=UPI001CE46D75|nr:nucleoside hydrolase [Inquilinus sp. Marseille-Q2685]